ncbi:MAG: hypothetical protein AB8I08_23710 [Sandaracinaceae bacterium]
MKRVALCLSLLATLTAAPASAECAMSRAFVAPSAGSRLPPNPTLYVFSPNSRHIDARVRSSTPMELGPREVFGSIAVQRVRFAVQRGSFSVTVGSEEVRYRVDPSWTRSESQPVLGAPSHVESVWMCSHTDEVQLDVQSNAPAFEVRWPGGRTIVPAHIERFWRAGASRTASPAVHLGHVSCLGFTVDGAARPRAARFEVTALYPDGSRATATSP